MYKKNNYVNTIPCNPQAEYAVLNTCLTNKAALSVVADWINPNDFFDARHRYIWVAIKRLFDRGEAVDAVSVVSELQVLKIINEAGGIELVRSIASLNYNPNSVETYAKTLRKFTLWRALVNVGQQIYSMGFRLSETAVEDAQNLLTEAVTVGANNTATAISGDMDAALAGLQDALSGKRTGVTTGIRDLDRLIRGLKKTDYILLAARPSVGKTAFALNIAMSAAKSGVPVAFFSIEMDRQLLVQRLILYAAGGDNTKAGTARAAERISSLPIYVDDQSDTLSSIKSSARRLQSQGKLGLLIIDYVGLIHSEGDGKRSTRNEEVSSISRELKKMAKALNVPVLALCQLSRAPEMTSDKRPQLSHLRDSGSLEQDADIVMLLYRSDYYDKGDDGDGPDETCDVIVAKNRNGATGTVHTVFKAEQQRFYGVCNYPVDGGRVGEMK